MKFDLKNPYLAIKKRLSGLQIIVFTCLNNLKTFANI